MNEGNATNSIMDLNHALYVIAGAKAHCSTLYSSGNNQIKAVGVQWSPPQLY